VAAIATAHQLCGGGAEWFFPLLDGGRIHPTADGHEAIAAEIEDVLADDGYQRAFLQQGETISYEIVVGALQELLDFLTFWGGSDFVMTLESPSGRIIERGSTAADVFHENGPGYEQFEITNPEPGVWTVSIFALEVDPGGEEVLFTSYQEGVPNERPIGAIEWTIDGDLVSLDGTSSADPDGEIVSFDWYVSSGADDAVYVGAEVEHRLVADEPVQITLVVTDNEGLTDFVTVRIFPMDIKPESSQNTLNPSARGVLPTALLSSAVFDATLIDTSSLTMGPGEATVAHEMDHVEDVNGDGLPDLVVHCPIPDLGSDRSTTTLCMSGVLTDGQSFEACDAVQIVGGGRR